MRTQPKQWRLLDAPPDGTGNHLARSLDLHPITGNLLARRGLKTPAEALEFLSPSVDGVHDPFLLPDSDQAVDRILYAISKGEPIFVHGDYDVDGITTAALYTRVLRRLGGTVIPFVPSRSREGYGVRPATVERAQGEGAGLLLTGDCGVSAHDACERAKELGLDMIVTDHHEPPEELPCAFAVVNPMRKDSRYPFTGLAGVGVAYKICEALCSRRGLDLQNLHGHFLDLVALGTVSDVAPLVGENRTYVYHGLKSIVSTKKHGLRALISASGLKTDGIGAEDVGFKLGPRLNAAGRLAEASEALELLLTTDEARAAEIARELGRRNSQRQTEQERIFTEALSVLQAEGTLDDRVLIVAREGWHPGVIGIVAGKLTEAFWRPAVVMAIRDGRCHGSARSIPGFSWAQAIGSLGPDLVQGGGHARAAGISFATHDLARVREELNQLAGSWLTEEDMTASIGIEEAIDPGDLDYGLAREISRLAPFGEANPEPIFMSSDVRLEGVRTLGRDGAHLKAAIAQTPHEVEVLGWGMGEWTGSWDPARKYKICYNFRVNHFNGSDRVELVLQDMPVIENQ